MQFVIIAVLFLLFTFFMLSAEACEPDQRSDNITCWVTGKPGRHDDHPKRAVARQATLFEGVGIMANSLILCGGTGAHAALAMMRLHTLGKALGFFRQSNGKQLDFPTLYLVDQERR